MQANFKQKVYKQKIVLEFLLFLFSPNEALPLQFNILYLFDTLLLKVKQISVKNFWREI